jgi:hypothetical protein
MLNERDNIAAVLAAPAIPNLLDDVDRESVGATALRARSNPLGAAAVQSDTPPRDFILKADSARLRDPVAPDQMVALACRTRIAYRGGVHLEMRPLLPHPGDWKLRDGGFFSGGKAFLFGLRSQVVALLRPAAVLKGSFQAKNDLAGQRSHLTPSRFRERSMECFIAADSELAATFLRHFTTSAR